jgi:hypothetical protein
VGADRHHKVREERGAPAAEVVEDSPMQRCLVLERSWLARKVEDLLAAEEGDAPIVAAERAAARPGQLA